MANGAMAEVEAVGTLPLRLDNGYILQLNNVIYVPSLSRNLISVSVLDDEGYFCNIRNRQSTFFMIIIMLVLPFDKTSCICFLLMTPQCL